MSEGDNSSQQVRPACAECRRRKQRCTGDRPACQFCTEKGQECAYEVADGKTRTEDLKIKVQQATERGERLGQLVGAMRSGTDKESSELLARLRVGATLDDLLDPEKRRDHYPEYIRNGPMPRPESSGMSPPKFPPVTFSLINLNIIGAATGGPLDAETTPSASSGYSFDLSMPRPNLSPTDIDEANAPFKQGFPS